MAHVVCSFHYKSYISLWVHRLVCSKNNHNHLLVWTYQEQCTFLYGCVCGVSTTMVQFSNINFPLQLDSTLYKLIFYFVTVCKQSQGTPHCFCSSACLLNSTCWFFFRLPVCEWPSALLQLNFWSLVSNQGIFLLETLPLIWPLDLNCSLAIHNNISVWHFVRRNSVQKSFDLNIHVKLPKTSEMPNLKTIFCPVQ